MQAIHTLGNSIVVEGVGLHTGAAARVTLHPAPAHRGRIFLCGGVEIPARVEYVTDTRRCTTLGRDGATLHTVEHLLAALALSHVDCADIHVDGPELPALDGSAHQWYALIQQAGVRSLGGEPDTVCVRAPQWVVDGGSEFFLAPSGSFLAYAALDIPDTIADHQFAGGAVDDPAVREQIVRARTFGLQAEVQALLDAGLARGGSLDNAVVLTTDGYLNADVWPLEPAWHKVLDLVGDLALLGARLQGQVLAVRGGHRSQVALARRLQTLEKCKVQSENCKL